VRERLEPWWQAQRNHCCHGAEVVLRIMPSSYGIIILCERAQDKDDCGTQYKYAVKRVGVQRDGCLSTVEGDDAMENALRLPLTSSLPHDAEDAKHGALQVRTCHAPASIAISWSSRCRHVPRVLPNHRFKVTASILNALLDPSWIHT